MIAKGTITERDYVAAQYLHLRPRRIFAIVGILLLLLLVLMIVFTYMLIGLALLIYLFCYFAILVPWRAKRIYRQYKALSSPIEYEAREDGLFAKSQNGESLQPWDHFHKWRENEKLMLLYPASNLFIIIPKHFFLTTESLQEFEDVLTSHLKQAV